MDSYVLIPKALQAFSAQRKNLKDKQPQGRLLDLINMRYIGLSGVAGAGKDLFFSLLSKRASCVRFSLADELKLDVRQWCIDSYGVDPVTCPRDQKEIVRPFLVFHGMQKRNKTKGRYWIDRLHSSIKVRESKIEEAFHEFPILSLTEREKLNVITDIRYDEYDNDEVGWLKDELHGKLVHITQYRDGVSKTPANEEEARNEPDLINKADYRIEWEYVKSGQTNQLMPHIDNFVSWYKTVNEN